MTDYQNELVMEHLDLVNWVIRTRISVPNRPLLTYDDFYAIGCEAICRAALKYQADSGEFAPFACRYIYNAIIDHCRAMNAGQSHLLLRKRVYLKAHGSF